MEEAINENRQLLTKLAMVVETQSQQALDIHHTLNAMSSKIGYTPEEMVVSEEIKDKGNA